MKQNGFVGIFVLVVIALAGLKYFLDWSIFDAINSEQGRATIGYVKQVLDTSWSYARGPLTLLWQKALGLVPAAVKLYENN